MTTPINTQAAIALVKNYGLNHWAQINLNPDLTALRNPDSTQDSRSGWVSMADLNSFIATSKALAQANCPNVDTSKMGVRFYWGEYPEAGSSMYGNELPQSLEQYAGMLTLLLVPTYREGSIDVDFDPGQGENGIPKAWSVFAKTAPTVNVADHMGVMPPPFNNYSAVGATFMVYADNS